MNLYFDNLQRTFFKWAEQKPDGRFNMRLRTYGENPGDGATCHFEVKEKRRDVVVKTRGSLKGGHPERLWEDTAAVMAAAGNEEGRSNLELFLRRAMSYDAHPVLQTQYRRIAWFGRFEDYARVTIDINMRWRPVDRMELSIDPAQMRPSDLPENLTPGTNAVLELKCERDQVPWWMLDLIRSLNLKHTGFSKFASATREELRRPRPRLAAW